MHSFECRNTVCAIIISLVAKYTYDIQSDEIYNFESSQSRIPNIIAFKQRKGEITQTVSV